MKNSYRPSHLIFRLLLPLLVLSACTPDDETDGPQIKEGYRPVYVSFEEMRNISTKPPQALKNPGKIYINGNYVFINEINEGIHIIDNRNPVYPKPISFVSIPGNMDLAVKDQILYADNSTDLVAFDISSPTAVKLVKRIQDVFPFQNYPPHFGTAFECVDASKGVVVRWEKTKLTDPKCFR